MINKLRHYLATATANVPAEMARWWHDGHRWDRQTHFYVDESGIARGGGGTRTMTRIVDPDYRLWQTLGRVSDAILLLVVALIVLAAVS